LVKLLLLCLSLLLFVCWYVYDKMLSAAGHSEVVQCKPEQLCSFVALCV